LAERYCQENTTIYDLGCSLGGATFAAAYQVSCSDYSIVAVDNSPAMIDKLQHRLATEPGQRDHIQCRCASCQALAISIWEAWPCLYSTPGCAGENFCE
ncbi:MAG TPA: methyltransferase domain-containing protein, partial [Rhodospirillales bacterium]|nr:methyltransferase domain-containing protein [Rhodospirillales bacterium]